jgi:hypothetical protein
LILLSVAVAAPALAQSENPPEPADDGCHCIRLGRTAEWVWDPREPWRLSSALNLPSWLEISGDQRTRYESLTNQFRRGFRGSDQGLFLRNRLKISLHSDVPEVTLG